MRNAVLIVPGHNSHGEKPRFLALENALISRGFSVVRFSATRVEHHEGGDVVLTVSEEYEQVLSVARQMRSSHESLIVAGHSQGGAIAMRLGYEGEADGVVSLMGDVSCQEDVNHVLKMLGKTLDEIRSEEYVRCERDSGQVNWYTVDWFEDYLLWNIPIYATGDFPKLFIAASDDPWNTPEKMQELFSEAAEPKQFEVISSEHNFEDQHVEEIAKLIEKWTTRLLLFTSKNL